MSLTSNEAVNSADEKIQLPDKNSLIWVSAQLNGQEIPMMVDSGANPNCISLRCFQGSPFLRH